MGIDFLRYGPDDPIEGTGNAIQSNVVAQRQAAGGALTRRKLEAQFLLGSRQPPILGSAAQVADTLEAWVDQADVDGFNLSRTVMPECLVDFIDLVVPVLQERGRYKTGYASGTLREKLFGAGPRLVAPHPAA